MKVKIILSGCDADTEIEKEVSKTEMEFLKELEKEVNKAAKFNCNPTLVII